MEDMMRFYQMLQEIDLTLCRLFNSKGIFAYRSEMREKNLLGNAVVKGWKQDRASLEEVISIRNLLYHGSKPEEREIPREALIWLEDFLRRLKTQNDPISLLRKYEAENQE